MMTIGKYHHTNHFLKVYMAFKRLLQTFVADPDGDFQFCFIFVEPTCSQYA